MLSFAINLAFMITYASTEANFDGNYYAQPTQDTMGFSSPQGFPLQQLNSTMKIYGNTGDQRGNLMNLVDAREIKKSLSLDSGKQLAGIAPRQQACARSISGNGAGNREIGESDAILDYGNGGYSASGGNIGYGGYGFPVSGKMTIMDRKHSGKSLPCIASETIVATSFLEKPPITVPPSPRIIAFTKIEEPVTKTLPPLIFRAPTTVFKQLRPMTVTTTLPPQIMKQPPIIKAVKQKIILPPSTVAVSKAFPPIIQMVKAPGPSRLAPTKPSTVHKHLTQEVPNPLVKTEYRFLTPNGVVTAEGGSGYNRPFGPNRNNNLHEGRSGPGNSSGNGSESFYGANSGSRFAYGNGGFGGIGSYGIAHNGQDILPAGGKPDTGSAQNPSFYYLNGNQGNRPFNGGFSQQSGIQCTENNSLGGIVSLMGSMFSPNPGEGCSESNFKSCFLGEQTDGEVNSGDYLVNNQNDYMSLVDGNGNVTECSKLLSCDGSNSKVLFMND